VWSEPFADLNGNEKYDEDEPYIDTDNSQAFTARLVQSDVNGNNKRDIGLLERYRMHVWGNQVMSLVTIDEVVPTPADDASAAAAGVPATGVPAPVAAASVP
jgi:hypothetical protein